MKKPRPFSHRPIYIDNRQERLAEMGVFSSRRHLTDRLRKSKKGLSTPKVVLLIVILLTIWRLLL